MIVRQELKVDGGKVVLRNMDEDTPETRDVYARRCEHYDADNPKGWTSGRTMLHLCRIPENVYHFDSLCREYQRLKAAGNPEEARRVLRLFLAMNPQYRASDANL